MSQHEHDGASDAENAPGAGDAPTSEGLAADTAQRADASGSVSTARSVEAGEPLPAGPAEPAPVAVAAAPRRRGAAETLDRRALERRYRLMRNLVVLLVALVVVLGGVSVSQLVQLQSAETVGAAASATGASAEAGASAQPGEAGSCPAPERREPNDPMALGDVDAPVVIAEWTDFRCPYCGVFSRDTLPTLIEEYVDTGKVRLEVHNVDFIDGDVSARVAVAARAAGEQDRYFEYLFEVYDAMHQERPEITDSLLVDYAKQAGVPDIARFTADLDSSELLAELRASSAQAKQLGVGSVPFFAETDGCQVLQGAQPIEQFRGFLDSAVAAAEQGRGE